MANDPRAVKLGSLVEETRRAQKRSQRDVARAANIDIATMTRLEKGYYPTPTPATLRGLSKALGIPLLELYRIVEYVTPYDVVDMASTLLPGETDELRENFLARLIDEQGIDGTPAAA